MLFALVHHGISFSRFRRIFSCENVFHSQGKLVSTSTGVKVAYMMAATPSPPDPACRPSELQETYSNLLSRSETPTKVDQSMSFENSIYTDECRGRNSDPLSEVRTDQLEHRLGTKPQHQMPLLLHCGCPLWTGRKSDRSHSWFSSSVAQRFVVLFSTCKGFDARHSTVLDFWLFHEVSPLHSLTFLFFLFLVYLFHNFIIIVCWHYLFINHQHLHTSSP